MASFRESEPAFPTAREDWAAPERRAQLIAAYTSGACSFVPGLLPEAALALGADETLAVLRARLGGAIDDALDSRFTSSSPVALPTSIASPVAHEPDGRWLRATNMVGINVRTVGSFWGVVKYALTLPTCQDSIHILPIWEPGVVDSLYGLSSWELNREFYSAELHSLVPHLDSVSSQLRAVVHILHAMGKTVGMDVIPHTDRYSEIALAHPHFFEWLRRDGLRISDHRADLHEEVQEHLFAFLHAHGAASGESVPGNAIELFYDLDEDTRARVLFGTPADAGGREARRLAMVHHLHALGYEPVPATMAPPYRGLIVDPRDEARTIDGHGLEWRDYAIREPQTMSRVFGPLARYKLYERLDDNARWEIDFSRPRHEVWAYVCEKYDHFQRIYGFDFMRGDMSHVQMRPTGVPDEIDDHYDILRAVKKHIVEVRGVRHFGYFAESFLAPRDVMAYGDEVEHLEACGADSTLGDLQSTSVDSDEFLQLLRRYSDILHTRAVAPSFTVMTADKDDPRFDRFYLTGSALRLFCGLFLADMPSYMALGFETRDLHLEPAPNEHYTKLFVFHEVRGPKATHGPFVWGRNVELFDTLARLRHTADVILPSLRGRRHRWLVPPDPTLDDRHFAWTHGDDVPEWIFIANADTGAPAPRFTIPLHGSAPRALECAFSTAPLGQSAGRVLAGPLGYRIEAMKPGEGRIYRVVA